MSMLLLKLDPPLEARLVPRLSSSPIGMSPYLASPGGRFGELAMDGATLGLGGAAAAGGAYVPAPAPSPPLGLLGGCFACEFDDPVASCVPPALCLGTVNTFEYPDLKTREAAAGCTSGTDERYERGREEPPPPAPLPPPSIEKSPPPLAPPLPLGDGDGTPPPPPPPP